MILAGTGHRPEQLGGYAPSNTQARIYAVTLEHLVRLTPEKVISGMALGFDMMLAEACIELGIPFIAAVPCATQADVWPRASQERWRELISEAFEVKVLSRVYTHRCMQERNAWMVDHSDGLIACWNGETSGGTWNCIQYANQMGKHILARIDPRTVLKE